MFFTNTSVGFEVATNGTTGSPNVLFGYKRQEGTIFPVRDGTCDHGTTECKLCPLVATAYSVIAKYSGGASSSGTSISNAQWFATGEAAKTLASQPGIAGAVTGSPELAEAAAHQAPINEQELASGRVSGVVGLLVAARDILSKLKQNGDSAAAALLAELDNEMPRIVTFEFTQLQWRYGWDTSTPTPKLEQDTPLLPANYDVQGAVGLYSQWFNGWYSLRQAKQALMTGNIELSINSATPPNTIAPGSPEAKRLEKDHQKYLDVLQRFGRSLLENPKVVATFDYLDQIVPSGQ